MIDSCMYIPVKSSAKLRYGMLSLSINATVRSQKGIPLQVLHVVIEWLGLACTYNVRSIQSVRMTLQLRVQFWGGGGGGGGYTSRGEKENEVCTHLDTSHYFVPVAIETPSIMGVEALPFFEDFNSRLKRSTGEARSKDYFAAKNICAGTAEKYTYGFGICGEGFWV